MDIEHSFVREYWRRGGTMCLLSSVNGRLEILLKDGGELVALQPCSDYFEASRVAVAWKMQPPPRWPVESCLG